ncbi:hypothetical protein [Candidatus Magnetominusculus xianensis]|uniref:Secreted protein n=1 Tax=Candidatus Magnetominusculus xianensis TaxID=1748249 RepID=A0ABR5SDQ2_9BACT|nr:hypothetical protein [Candidatus Magnetominusculus xianensis]KWT83449.1 hypothetical protein ASN18_2199 [Candidatus Magnetominusculus xianensis]MBF0405093.1 hypothetical protein [Nitrospirota bacterium]
MLKKIIILSLLAAFLMIGSFAFAAPPDNYTGKMVLMGTGIAIEFARMGDKTRTESPAIKGLANISMPVAKKSISMYIPDKLYFEHTMDPNEMPSLHSSNVVFEKKELGKETIDGHPCTKYDAVYYLKDKPEDKYNAIIWEASDLGGLIIRYEVKMPETKKPVMPGNTGQSVVTEIKDIKIGAATASMFEVPKDYKKVSTMQELMAGAVNSFNPTNRNNAKNAEPIRPPMQKPEKDGETR